MKDYMHQIKTTKIYQGQCYEQLELLKHMLRVNEGEQFLFNAIKLSHDQTRLRNQKIWLQYDLFKLKLLYQLNELVDSEELDERSLYQLHEKLALLLSNSMPNLNQQPILDNHIITISLLNLLIRTCELIMHHDIKDKVHEDLCKSIILCIKTQFVRPYVKHMWQAVK